MFFSIYFTITVTINIARYVAEEVLQIEVPLLPAFDGDRRVDFFPSMCKRFFFSYL